MSLRDRDPDRHFPIGVLSGALISILVEMLVGGVAVDELMVHPGMVAYLSCLALTVPSLASDRAPWIRGLLYLSVGMALADLPSMIVRIRAPAQAAALPVLALGTGLALAYVLMGMWLPSRERVPRPIARSELRTMLLLATGVVVASQAGNRILRAAGVPNADRSLMLGGYEIHHINYGLLLLPLAHLAFTRTGDRTGTRPFSVAFIGVALGLIADQCVYYMLRAVTDDAYFSVPVVLGAVGGLVLIAATACRPGAPETPGSSP